MTASYNGFKASRDPADFGGLDNSFVPGTSAKIAPGLRKGDVAYVMFYFAEQFDKRVEDLDLYTGGDEWGYYYKQSANSSALLSCHSSATAMDLNATRHPNGRRGTFTAKQVAEIRKIQAEVNGVVYWGGDAWGGGTVDEMHFEIATGTTLDELAKAVAKIKALRAPKPTTYVLGSRTLRNGSTGSDVKALQVKLVHDYPLYADHLIADGDFGDKTEAVVREFQKRAGLTVDGIVGKSTFDALGV